MSYGLKDELVDSDGAPLSQNSRESDNTKFKIVPIVHAPGYQVQDTELQQYESIRNPMRIKEETFIKQGADG